MTPDTLLKGRYELVREIGRGSGAITYRAEDRATGRPCVIKHLSFAGAEDLKVVDLFRREAKVLKHLNHPRIPKFIDFFEVDSDDIHIYLVQECIEGDNLAALVKSGRHFTETEAVDIALKLSDILAYLHRFSPAIVHRDIKPSNVLLTPEGDVFLIDFGAVRDNLRHLGKVDATVVGTFGYMPLEQFGGQAAPASDVYSLGVTLIFMLSHLEPTDIPQKALRFDFKPYVAVSRPFQKLIDRMVDPDPNRRPENGSALREALLNLSGTEVSVKRRTDRRRIAVGILSVIILASFLHIGFQLKTGFHRRIEAEYSPRTAGTSVPGPSRTVPKPSPVRATPVEKKRSAGPETGSHGPVLHIPFDGTLKGKGLDVTYAPTGEGAPRFVSGKRDRAVELRASGIEYVQSAGMSGVLSGAFTIGFWFRLEKDPDAADFVHVFRSALFTVDVRKRNESVWFFHSRLGGNSPFSFHDAERPFEWNRWYHLASVYRPSTRRFEFFLDGRSLGERHNSMDLAETLDVLQVGVPDRAAGEGCRLLVDEFCVYDYARTGTQIAAEVLTDEPAAVFTVRGALFFDGRPIAETTPNSAEFWMRNESTGREHSADIRQGSGRFRIHGLKPGRYGLGVRIRDLSRPGFPGHFTAWKSITVSEKDPPGEVGIDMTRIIHLIHPQDNTTGMERWGAKCRGKMAFGSPVLFEWEAVVPGAEYAYRLESFRCEPFERIAEIATGSTLDTRLVVELPASGEQDIYLFHLSAVREGCRVGSLETYGLTGGRGWDYRFRVE